MSDFRIGRSRRPIATVSETLQDAPQLEPFVLPNVTPTGKLLGGGSYGVESYIQELGVDGLVRWEENLRRAHRSRKRGRTAHD